MNRLSIIISKPTVVVGLDFGTTFSGFAWALASDPEKVEKFYEWPFLTPAGGKNYCKTPTSLLYNCITRKGCAKSYELEDWAYAAFVKHADNLQRKDGTSKNDFNRGASSSFVTRFKLLLAGEAARAYGDIDDINIPNGLTVRTATADYLRKLSDLILRVLQGRLGDQITMEDIQWCLTVPAIWTESAKQEMTECAEIAGLIQGQHCVNKKASPHPLIIVLEPEAASVHCQENSGRFLKNGDKFLVVDVGGGTVDLVLHEKVGDLKVREISASSGGLCGGTYVDQCFLKFLCGKIRCFQKFGVEQPQSLLKMKALLETIKHSFDGSDRYAYELELPAKLGRAWEADEKYLQTTHLDFSFDSVDLSVADMRSIFDPVVDRILNLIDRKMITGLKAMMVVGGFAASPYLQKRINETFSQKVDAIIFPHDPGSAICCGAVSYAVNGADLIVSRVSKQTYGIVITRPFKIGDPPHLRKSCCNGISCCYNVFDVFVENGQNIAVDECVSRTFHPHTTTQTETRINLYSTSTKDPVYVDDPGVRKLGSFKIKHPSELQLGAIAKFTVSMYFGRATLEVRAAGLNFVEDEIFSMAPVTFERSSSSL